MPTYEYQCSACGHHFEAFQSMVEEPLQKCPSCNKKKLERLIGAGAAVIFKGSGFFQTDYRSESFKRDSAKDGPPASPPCAGQCKAGKNGTCPASDGNADK
ncbi:MAG: zinc ribbon domain-containing protein [Planctomycetota bacterium]